MYRLLEDLIIFSEGEGADICAEKPTAAQKTSEPKHIIPSDIS